MDIIYKCKKYAFTLAEVLITLGIVGIVAALVIPVLVRGAEKQAGVSAAIKYQNVFQSVVLKYIADNGFNTLIEADVFNNGASFTQAGTQRAWDALKGYFSIAQDCGAAANPGCFPNNTLQINNTYHSAASEKSPDSSNLYAKAILNDGAVIAFLDDSGNCSFDRSISHTGLFKTSCGLFRVDYNGKKGPNKWGRDEFFYWLFPNGQVYPMGTSDDYFKGCDSTSTDVTAGADGSPGSGYGCTYVVTSTQAMNY